MPQLSVIIPARNEAANIAAAIRSARVRPRVEVIVVDGGSTDQTQSIAQHTGARLVTSRPGRALQMNTGARAALGDILVFLHADTVLPTGYVALIRQILQRPDAVAGAFRLRIDGNGWALRLVEFGANRRARQRAMPYGDQGLFISATRFRQLGGYPELPVMEDYALMRCLRRHGPIRLAPAAVRTSPRRWQRRGVWRTTLLHQLMIVAYHLGVAPACIARWRDSKCTASVCHARDFGSKRQGGGLNCPESQFGDMARRCYVQVSRIQRTTHLIFWSYFFWSYFEIFPILLEQLHWHYHCFRRH